MQKNLKNVLLIDLLTGLRVLISFPLQGIVEGSN